MVFLQSSRAMASIRRIDEVLDEPIDLSDENASQKDRKVEKGRVEFKDVSFSYREGGEPVLSHISLTAEPGETIGILGATGSGKTSLVQLIPRLYDVTEGSVRVDGIDVREYSLKNLRDGVGMVLQKNVLFSGTIEENLRWGDETATEEEVRRAAVYAQADSFVNSFAEAYKTEMGQGGVNVSGGRNNGCHRKCTLKEAEDPDSRRQHQCGRYGNGGGDPDGIPGRLERYDEIYYRTAAEFAGIRGSDSRP
ncbi:MAG: ATP-binding cassette domain-containing protein [Clostridium fessum]